MKFRNILVVRKTPKLNYLMSKYDISKIKNSMEYEIIKNGAVNHEENSENFINCLRQYEKKLYENLHVVNDFYLITENKRQDNVELDFSDYDLIFSLGGDGTFLRTSYILNEIDALLVGVNTDSDFSHGYYCSLNKLNIKENLNSNVLKLLNKEYQERLLNRHLVIRENKMKYYFLNDLYFGEKHLGGVTKFRITTDKTENRLIKSSGIICSTLNGLSGWIKNSNNISHKKFLHYLKQISEEVKFNISNLSDEQILKLYNFSYTPPHENPDNIFYHVREPHITDKLRNIYRDIDDYLNYLKDLEGSTTNIQIQCFGYDCFFIIDGFFEVQIGYNESFYIQTVNKKLRTIYKL